ncbi:MAG: alpha-(1-_6)-mannopyranosyltransferase A [Corynebacterium sp.]|nr:alpha-(1->6)-mannopyranosyltransferase A [Corynebacterium sp.]
MTATLRTRNSPDARQLVIPSPKVLGVWGTVLLAIASYLAGATRNRNGILEALNIGFLSSGHGRNFGMVMFWIGMVLLVCAWVILGKTVVLPQWHTKAATGPAGPAKSLRAVQRSLWAWVVPLLVAAPLSSRDVYSYLMQGAMVRDGFDPYNEGAAINPGPFLLEVSYDWRNTTTPYGPLHLWMGDIVTRIVGDNVTLGVVMYKIISVLGFAAIAFAIPRIARALGGNPTLALWIGVANPVMILHLVGGMHNESVMVGLVSLGLLLCVRHHFLAGIAVIGVAVALKVTAFIALPFVCWMMVHQYGQRFHKLTVFVIGGLMLLLETAGVVAVVTWASGSSWGWLSEITGNSKVVNPLAGPTFVADLISPLLTALNEDLTYNRILAVARTVSALLMLAGLAVTWWYFRRTTKQVFWGIPVAYQVAFIFNSVTLPWYYASVISLIGVARPPRWILQLAIAATVFISFSFSSDGNHQLYTLWWVAGSLLLAWQVSAWLIGKQVQPQHLKS